jgi:hypothetical protein
MQPAPLPSAPAPLPTTLDPSVKKRREDERRLAALASGRASTVLTSAQGLSPLDPAGRKTLLGQ